MEHRRGQCRVLPALPDFCLPDGHKALLMDGSETDGLVPCTWTQQVGSAAFQPHLKRSIIATLPRAMLALTQQSAALLGVPCSHPQLQDAQQSKQSGKSPIREENALPEDAIEAAPCVRSKQSAPPAELGVQETPGATQTVCHSAGINPVSSTLHKSGPFFLLHSPTVLVLLFFLSHGILKAIEKQRFNLVRICNF